MRDVERGEELGRPIALSHVEEEGPCCVGGVSGVSASEAQADVVLRQEDVGDTSVVRWFFVAQPKDFGCLKASVGWVASDGD